MPNVYCTNVTIWTAQWVFVKAYFSKCTNDLQALIWDCFACVHFVYIPYSRVQIEQDHGPHNTQQNFLPSRY